MTDHLRLLLGVEEGLRHVDRLRTQAHSSQSPEEQQRTREIFGQTLIPQEAVQRIVQDVRERGDEAVGEWTRRVDGVAIDSMSVTAEALDNAYQSISPELRHALHLAADRIRAFHEREPRDSWLHSDSDKGALGQLLRPLASVGVYVPAGRASYPSSLLMAAIPAQVAGVSDIVITTPPGRGGRGDPAILAAARVVGVTEVYLVGGAQAIAALAYGTETIPKVDKIAGAGGRYVTLAKRAVYGDVGIDGLYGPTETLIVADQSADPALVAADLLAQAEHDPLATALLVTTSADLAVAVQLQLKLQIPALQRQGIIVESLTRTAAAIVVADLDEALRVSNEFAPEHLCLAVRDPWGCLEGVTNAGGVFMGERASEALGDYVIGPSHVMPTSGTARFASPLHVRDFLKVTSIFAPARQTIDVIAPAGAVIARAEGLSAHAAAIEARLEP